MDFSSKISCLIVSLARLKLNIRKHRVIYAIIILYIVAVGTLAWMSNFPVNDDLAYTLSVNSVCQSNQLKILGSVATCFVPILLGAFFCKLLGFSYSLLHLVSVVLTAVAALGIYFTSLELRFSKSVALLSSAMFLANPLVMFLAICYMTDIPSLTLLSWIIFFIAKGLRTQSKSDWFGCSALFVLSVATRQSCLVMYPAFILLAFLLISLKSRSAWFFVASLFAPALAYLVLKKLMLSATVYTASANGYMAIFLHETSLLLTTPEASWPNLFLVGAKICCYLGLFFIPLTLPSCLCFITAKLSRYRRSLTCAGIIIAMLVSLPQLGIIRMQQYMPYFRNLLNPPLVGAYCLLGGESGHWGLPQLKTLSYVSVISSMLFCIVISVSILTIFLILIRIRYNTVQAIFISLKNRRAVFYAFSLVAFTSLFIFTCILLLVQGLDRYLLTILLPAQFLCLAAWHWLRIKRYIIVGFFLVAIMCLYSYIGTLDFVCFNRSRAAAISWLEKHGVNPLEIDGGPEFNLLINPGLSSSFDYSTTARGWPQEDRGRFPLCNERWWPINKETYIISLKQLDGYKEVQAIPYFSFLRNKFCKVLILELVKPDTQPANSDHSKLKKNPH